MSEKNENRTIFKPSFKKGENLAKPLKLLQRHIGNAYVENYIIPVIVRRDGPFISIVPKKKKINFDSLLFNSMGFDGITRDIRVRFKKEKPNKKSIFVLIKTSRGEVMFEIFETAGKKV